eukprot:GILJ01013497.1.p1 GENE.GILJ01013497.1~~GILJ01013497.1.p1  ORF type:complete len:621 (-),score=107.03 GILJ01013497.1:669-2324(-)
MAFFGDPFSIEVHLATVALLGPCATNSDQQLGRISRYLLSPFIDLGATAVAIVHFAIGIVVLALHVSLLVMLRFIHSSDDNGKARQAIPFAGEWWSRTMFPSIPFIVALVLYPGAATAFFDLVREGEGSEMYVGLVLSALHMLWPLALAGLCTYKLQKQTEFKTAEHRLGVWRKLVEPKGAWLPATADWAFVGVRGFTAGGSSAFAKVTSGAVPFLTLGLVIVVVGVVGASNSFNGSYYSSDADISSYTNCAPRSYAAGAIVGLLGVYVAGTMPFRAIVTDILTCACLLSLAAVLVISGLEADGGYLSAASGSTTWKVKVAALMILAVCSVLRTVHIAIILVFSKFSHRYVKNEVGTHLYIDQFESSPDKEMFEVVDDEDNELVLPNQSDRSRSNISGESTQPKAANAVAVVFDEDGIFEEPEKAKAKAAPTSIASKPDISKATPYDDFDSSTSSSSEELESSARAPPPKASIALEMFTDSEVDEFDSDINNNMNETKAEVPVNHLPKAPPFGGNLHRDDELQSTSDESAARSIDSRDDKQRAECVEAAYY